VRLHHARTTLLLAILHTRRGGNESLMQKAIQAMPVQTRRPRRTADVANDASRGAGRNGFKTGSRADKKP